MSIYCVSGGCGFIGSHLVDRLIADGHEVRIIDDLSTGFAENRNPKTEFFQRDIIHLPEVERAVDGCDCIFHQAALPSVPRSVRDPWSTNDVNVRGTLNVLWAAKEVGVRRVVLASSSSVYGNPTPSTLHDAKHESLRCVPLSPYAVSKLAAEAYAAAFTSTYGLETVALRYFNVFGPRQDPSSQYSAVIPKFITAALRGEPIEVHGDGEQMRDFTYVDNVVEANLLAAEAPAAEVSGQAFNVGCGAATSLNQLLLALGRTIPGIVELIKYAAPRPGDVRMSRADITRLKSIGYNPKVDLAEGLKRTLEYYLTALSTTPRPPL
jgi:nucleoside-diphosphate-sugar epimerase